MAAVNAFTPCGASVCMFMGVALPMAVTGWASLTSTFLPLNQKNPKTRITSTATTARKRFNIWFCFADFSSSRLDVLQYDSYRREPRRWPPNRDGVPPEECEPTTSQHRRCQGPARRPGAEWGRYPGSHPQNGRCSR